MPSIQRSKCLPVADLQQDGDERANLGPSKIISRQMTCQGDGAGPLARVRRFFTERIVPVLRWVIPVAIVIYLVEDVRRQDHFDQIWSGAKDWSLLGVALF